MKREWDELLSLTPGPPDWRIDWDDLHGSRLQPYFTKMSETEQNPAWHGEGDVWSHTRMVCEELAAMPSYRSLPEKQRQEVFLAALLHDIGKIPCTRLEEGRLISPNHTAVGARMAREILRVWYGLGGTGEQLEFRETICNLIRYHSVPTHILDQPDPKRKLFQVASDGELAGDFSIALLCILGEADVRGRIYKNVEDSAGMVRLCAEFAEELTCLDGPFLFSDPYTEYAYLSGRNIVPGQELYDDTWGEVLLMSGLPGTGKDTWILEHHGDLPMISLDRIRKEMHISPLDNQGPVAAQARETAKEYLRKKQPFIWNATSLTPSLREKQIRLFHNYGASVHVIYLETGWEEQLCRNQNRTESVPEQAIFQMQRNLVLPERFEAEKVTWLSI